MPESGGVVDRLVIATEFDESGLDRGTKAQLAHLERFVAQVGQLSRNLPPITVDATQITTALQNAGGDLDAFARILGQLSPTEFVTALDQMVQELGEAGGQFKATSAEGRAFHAAIEALKVAQAQAAGATQGVIGAFGQEAGAARLAASAATDLASALARTGEETRRLAAQGSQPLALNVQPAINAADTLISRMGLAQRSVASVRQVLATPLPPIPPDPNLPILARGYQLLTLEVQQADQRLAGLRATMLQQGQAARLASGDNAAAAASIGRLGASAATIGPSFISAGAGASRLRAGLTGIAIASSGASPAIGQLVSGLLLLGAGSIAVLGAAAGIALVASAINLLEGPAREAREEADKLIASLKQAERSRLPAFQQVALDIQDIQRQSDEAITRIARLQLLIAAQGRGGAFFFPELPKEIERVKEFQRQIELLNQVKVQLQFERGNDLIRGLGIQLATFGKTALEAQRLGIALDQDLTPAQRRAATAVLDTLIQLDRQKKRAEEVAQILGRVGGIGPATFLELPALELKPRIDTSELVAGMDAINAAAARGILDDEIERARLAGLGLADALAEVGLSLKDIGNANIAGDFKRARTEAEKMADTLADAFAIMDAFAGFGESTGILSEQDIRAFETFQDAATSVGKFATGDIVGGLVAALDTLGGIFGKSAMQQEHEAILRENSAAINRNTIAQNERLQGASGVALGQSAIDVAQANEAFQVLEGISLLGLSTAALEEALKGTGLSLQELDAIARDNDIVLLDSKGRLVAGALDQLDIALKQAEERITHFGTSLDAQSARMATRDKLGLGPNAGLPEDVQALARTRDLQLSGLELDPQLEARIAGLDLATEEGRQAFLEFNRMLFGMAERGELTAEQLDAFGNVDTLNLSLGTAADQINAFGETARDAANELSIVPKGFRQAALAFEAQIPGLTAPLPPLPPPPPPLPPPPPPAPTVDEAIPPGEAITADAALERLIPEPILISGAELLDRMVAFGAIPAITGLPTGVPSDGAALPQIAATLTSSHAVLSQIAAALGASGTPDALASQRGNDAIARLLEFLAKAKIGHTVENVNIQIDSDGTDPRDVALEIRRALEDISMADYGRTDRWGQT